MSGAFLQEQTSCLFPICPVLLWEHSLSFRHGLHQFPMCWYRLFLNQTSARIPERCVESNRCGTHAPLWITQPHPTWSGEIVNRTVCNVWSGSCCHFQSHTIHVKLCHANYYVYKLVKPYTCNLAYCAGKPML
uniref:UMOD/GP2/OIT3-like D8C domain-containing protein n=1 Tax=Astatotilapia calliptera TaxID=8154 RepID=A0AAX7TYS5_ASTCA